MIRKLYHGCTSVNVESVMNDISVSGRGFFMTPDITIAQGYGSKVVCFEVGEFDSHIGTIDKGGDLSEDLSSGIEYVLKNQQHLVSFYKSLEDVYTV